MARIKLDHHRLENTASAIDTYVNTHKNYMKEIGNQIANMGNSWQGTDYNQVKYEWEQMNDYYSVSAEMLRSLENYADFLRCASSKYKEAQSKAVNRARALDRW